MLVERRINFIGYLFINMTLKKSFQDVVLQVFFEGNFDFNFASLHQLIFFSHNRVAFGVASIGSFSFGIKTAMVVIPDISGTSLKKRFSYLENVIHRNISNKLVDK